MSEDQTTAAALANDCEAWLKKFKGQDGERPYWEQLNNLPANSHGKEKATFKIKQPELPDKLAVILLHRPDEFMEGMKDGIISIEREIHPDYAQWLKDNLEIEIYGLPPQKRLDRNMLNKFVALGPCQVTRIEPLRNVKLKANFRCTNCNTVATVSMMDGALKEPKKCKACSEKELVEEMEGTFLDDQRYIEVIMTGDKDLATEKALKYWLDIRGEKAFNIPDFGETWLVSGFVRLAEDQDRAPIAENKMHFLYLEVNTIEKVTTETDRTITVTPELMKARRLWVISQKGDVEEALIRKLAPWIVGEDLLKKTLLRQAVSGCVINMAERSSIHVLVMRNPGKAKTKLAMAMARLTDSGYFTGPGVSKVGLIVGIDTDKRTNKRSAKAGVGIIYKGKPKYFDEVDKTEKKEEVLGELNTPMEEGFYMETKILNARFEVPGPWCLFGNFRNRKYSPKGSLSWNINLPADLMDRFDVLHVEPTSTYDMETEDEILDAQSDKFEKGEEMMQIDQELREHIACARSITRVTFEPGIREIFKSFYHDMKKLEQFMDGGSMFEKRQFNGLYRQAVARAVLHLREVVTKEDAEAAVKHLTGVIAKIGIDPTTGQVDQGILTGDQKSKQNRLKIFKPIMAQAQGSRHDDIPEEILIKQLVASGTFKTQEEAKAVIAEAREARMVKTTRPGYLQLV